MSFLFISSTGERAGHTLMTWAIARRLSGEGLNVGFLKPFGTHPLESHGRWSDEDALLFKEALQLQEPLERLCPYIVSDGSWRQKGSEKIMGEFKALAQEVHGEKDILLVMGSQHIFFDDTPCPIPDSSLITELEADLILVHRYRRVSRSIYSILSVTSLLKERMKGIILNRVPPSEFPEVREQMVPAMSRKGIPITAALPEDALLSSRSLREVRDALQGEFLGGEPDPGRPVGGMTVGSADLTGPLDLFKRAYNKIVLLAASPVAGTEAPMARRSIAGIILTGGRAPAPQLVEAAKRAELPLMAVKDDTFTALERLEQGSSRFSPQDTDKVGHVIEVMEHEGAFQRLFASLRLSPAPGRFDSQIR